MENHNFVRTNFSQQSKKKKMWDMKVRKRHSRAWQERLMSSPPAPLQGKNFETSIEMAKNVSRIHILLETVCREQENMVLKFEIPDAKTKLSVVFTVLFQRLRAKPWGGYSGVGRSLFGAPSNNNISPWDVKDTHKLQNPMLWIMTNHLLESLNN